MILTGIINSIECSLVNVITVFIWCYGIDCGYITRSDIMNDLTVSK